MTSPGDPQPANDPYWYEYLTKGDSMERRARRLFTHIPHGPRCKICAAPFGGPGAPFMRVIGKRPSDKNPAMCNSCFAHLAKHHGGAEIEASFLFADIRGSTALAERMSPTEFRALLDRFYVAAGTAVFDHDGGVDKFVGDELVAFFFPLMTGARHAAKAVAAATALLRMTGHDDPGGPWVPVGAGVATGKAWVGAVGDERRMDITALGDPVNTTARLAAVARAGEVLVTVEAAEAAGLDRSLEPRELELKGKQSPTRVVSLTVGPTAALAGSG
ncbi:MAG TPA: adenylate/guanylate cyclase domain-containing protein [Candidatus Limnocylindrales bacterium]|nr:adenylate/guanylate cyclase domain-containing protein [Candidatus Limnocylindrales bacterium]